VVYGLTAQRDFFFFACLCLIMFGDDGICEKIKILSYTLENSELKFPGAALAVLNTVVP